MEFSCLGKSEIQSFEANMWKPIVVKLSAATLAFRLTYCIEAKWCNSLRNARMAWIKSPSRQMICMHRVNILAHLTCWLSVSITFGRLQNCWAIYKPWITTCASMAKTKEYFGRHWAKANKTFPWLSLAIAPIPMVLVYRHIYIDFNLIICRLLPVRNDVILLYFNWSRSLEFLQGWDCWTNNIYDSGISVFKDKIISYSP